MRITYTLIAFVLLLANCGDTTPSKEAASIDKHKAQQLPIFPDMLRTQLYQSCDAIDVIFYGLPVSMSQVDKPSILKSISFIGNEPVTLNPSCKPIGHISFNGQGETLQEVEIYFSAGCNYYTFQGKDEVQYATNINEKGMNFFSQIITQFSTQPNR